MTILKKRIAYVIMGLSAGLLAMGLVEAVLRTPSLNYITSNLLQGTVLGFAFGLVFGLTDVFLYKDRSGFRRALYGISFGAGAGALAVLISTQVMLLLNLQGASTSNIGYWLLLALVRGLSWMLPGAVIGALEGASNRQPARSVAGALGGLSGGLLGGLMLELMSTLLPGVILARAAGFMLMGLSIGFFLGLFERRFSWARLRVLNGSQRDVEYLLADRQLSLGSSPKDHLRFPGYSGVTRSHAQISKRSIDMIFQAADTPAGETASAADVTRINEEQPEAEVLLKYGDVLDLGSLRLLLLAP